MAEHAHTPYERRIAAAPGASGRRTLFAGAALALAGAGAIAETSRRRDVLLSPSHPDATLVRLGKQLAAAVATEAAAWRALDLSPEHDDNGPLTVEAMRLQGLSGDVVHEIEDYTATTEAGLAVKLRAFAWCRGRVMKDERDAATTDERLLVSLRDDLAGMYRFLLSEG